MSKVRVRVALNIVTKFELLTVFITFTGLKFEHKPECMDTCIFLSLYVYTYKKNKKKNALLYSSKKAKFQAGTVIIAI